MEGLPADPHAVILKSSKCDAMSIGRELTLNVAAIWGIHTDIPVLNTFIFTPMAFSSSNFRLLSCQMLVKHVKFHGIGDYQFFRSKPRLVFGKREIS